MLSANELTKVSSQQHASEFNSVVVVVTRRLYLSTRSILTLVGSALATFCTTGFVNAFGAFLDYHQRHLLTDKSAFHLSWIGSFSTFVFSVAAAPAGMLVHRIGPTVSLEPT